MSPEMIGALGITIMVVFMFLRMPIAFTMALFGFVGFSYVTSLQGSLYLLGFGLYHQFTSYTMLVVPLFVLMGEIAFHAGISKRLYNTANAWLGFVPGGLAVATIGACAGFSAICGSSAATAATMGTVALPEMKKFRYDDAFATGTVAAGGTLGILIPPSIVLIVYGIMVEQSIGKLFIAGILPGIVLAALFILCILIMCIRKPTLGPPAPQTTWLQKFKSLSGTLEMLILFFLVMGGMMLGWFTPTEAAGIGAAGAIVVALVGRNLSWTTFKQALHGTTRTASMVLLIIGCAMIFSRFLTVSGLPQGLAHWVSDLNAPPWVILGIVMLIYIIGGCVMDSLSLLIITINIFYPIITGLGYDPIWFGVIIVVLMETGAVTPPVGINVYVIKGIAPDVELYTIFKGIVPFLGMMIICLVILTIWPDIALVLPRMMK